MSKVEYSVYVSLLGRFSIRCLDGDRAAAAPDASPAHLRQRGFLPYLCAFHDRPVSQEELVEAIWEGEGESADPAKALKTTLYRARQLLERAGLRDAKELLLYRQGFYSWSPQVHITLDTERFDQLYERFYAADQPYQGLEDALQALALYQGDFLSGSSEGLWALSLRTYYREKYIKLARDAAQVLWQEGRPEEGAELCKRAAAANPYDEETQLLLMRLFHAAGLTQSAIRHYETIQSLFMEQLGVALSQELSDFYRKLTRTDEPRELDLQVIRSRLWEDSPATGAYFCEYSIFQNIYRLIARSTARTGQAVQLAMVVLQDADSAPLAVKRCAETMDVLHDAIARSLRTGDVFTRFSRDQYLIMLPSCSHENAAIALERAIAVYRPTPCGLTTQVKYTVLPVLPPRPVQEARSPAFAPVPRR